MARTEVTGRQIKDKSVSLTDDVVDTLPVSNGGTGNTTLTAGGLLVGNGTDAVSIVSPGASGYVLTSNGSTWISAAPSGEVTLNGAETLYNKTISGASNTLTDIPVTALSTTGVAGSTTYLRGDGTWATVELPAGAIIDGVEVGSETFQLFSGTTPIGDPIPITLGNVDGGTPSSVTTATVDGGQL